MWLNDKIRMFRAYKLARDAERKYIKIDKEARQVESEMADQEYWADPDSRSVRECAAAIIAGYTIGTRNEYYSARQKYYQSKYRTTRNSEKRLKMSHKFHQTPEPITAISAIGTQDMFLL